MIERALAAVAAATAVVAVAAVVAAVAAVAAAVLSPPSSFAVALAGGRRGLPSSPSCTAKTGWGCGGGDLNSPE